MARKRFANYADAVKFAKCHLNGVFGSTGVEQQKQGNKTIYVVWYTQVNK